MTGIETYAATAIEHAAIALLWQASDASEDGGEGFPIGEGGNEYSARVVEEVPYLTETVTAFVAAGWDVLTRIAHVSAEQCGHDFILTANGHGAGFWDRGLDMPVNDEEALEAWRRAPRKYAAWLKEHRPYPGDHPQSAGDYLTAATRGYSFEAEFMLDEDGDVTWLCVENTVLVDEMGLASGPVPNPDPFEVRDF